MTLRQKALVADPVEGGLGNVGDLLLMIGRGTRWNLPPLGQLRCAPMYEDHAIIALSACDVERGTSHPPSNDVNPGWTCQVERGRVRSSGTITNQSSKPSLYVIDVEFRLDGGVVDRSTVGIDDVDPGETAYVETSSFDVVDDDVTCHVVSVDRFEA